MSDPSFIASREEIAIIGMAGHFPGARDIHAFWRNLKEGVESIKAYTVQELQASGIDVSVLTDPTYVNAGAVMDDADLFDATFFGFSPREAEITDPQHRVFLECAWEALENAGYDVETYSGYIGVYGGVARNTYFINNVAGHQDLLRSVGSYQTLIGTEKDFPATRVSYKLNLKGPSINVQTACSTSGVALHLACQSLLSGECDMALAGGARVQVPLKSGYFYQEGGILSPDGHCRAFDAKARGTVIGSGVAIVVLKRLSEAIKDRDCIRAIIKGTAINNDGSAKIGFTAPSIEGQSRAIAEAHAIADVDPETITYIEAHGTGTSLGDPIEVAALTKVFTQSTEKRGFCAIGSVKTNIGHLDAGAGVAGVIKTVLSLEHKLIPPSLNFEEPNPQIDFQNSPFFVNSKLAEWKTGNSPRRAGVSAFGLGGTNAHVVLEEAPVPEPPAESRPWKLLPLSAKTPSALDTATSNLLEHLQNHPEIDLADIAYTLQVGRRAFSQRRMLVAQDLADAIRVLSSADPRRIISENQNGRVPSICFLFPGGGAQYINMGVEIYQTEPVFRNWMDHCFRILKPQLDVDLKNLVYQNEGDIDKAAEQLTIPKNALPALFATEYSLAKLFISWGLKPSAMIGHSLGEYAAACLSGVLSLEDAFSLVIARSRLFEKLPEGGMLSVPLSVEEVRSLGVDGLSIAAINRPALCVVSGSTAAIDEMQKVLTAKQIDFSRLHISVAAHSHMVEPILAEFRELVRKIRFQQPQIPYVSNVTGEWITAAEATDPEYWVKHLRQTVRFSDGLRTLFANADRLLLEVGPGQTLSTFARQHPDKKPGHAVLASLRHPKEQISDVAFLFNSIGRLWLAGAPIHWMDFNHHEKRRRVELPGYPFERKRYWIDPIPTLISQTAPNILPQEDFSKMITSDGELAATAVRQGEVTPVSQIPTNPTMSRKDRVVGILQNIIHELSGMDKSEMDPYATFLEMGFESLFLTQASAAFQNELGVEISFRQLFEDTPSLDSLAAYVDSHLPPGALAAPEIAVPTVTATPVVPQEASATIQTSQVPLSGNALERIAAGLEALVGILRGGGVVPSQQMSTVANLLTAGVAAPQAVEKKPPQPVTEKKTATRSFGPWKPIEKGAGGKLTSRQQEHLNALIARFTARTPESKRFVQEHRERLADPRTVAGFRLAWKEMVYPIVASRALGSKIWDVDGNEWLDITQGFGINLFGHSPSFVVEAVQQQLKENMAIGPQTPLAGKVADLIHELTGMERVAFCNTGSEAVLAALRLTRTVSGRNRIATFSGDYHGVFDEVLVRGITVNGQRRSLPVAPGIPPKMVEDVLVLDYGEAESLNIIQQHAKELAAVLVEPIQSRNPGLQPREFLHSLRDLTKKLGIPLIFDEMITGFRLHHRGAQGWFGVDADLAAYGKVIAGGMPIGVIAGKAKYMDALDGGMWKFDDASVPEVGVTWFAGTFVRHPLSLAAAYASLKHLKEQGPQLQQKLNETTSSFVSEVNDYFQKNSFPIRLVHFASLFLIHFEGDQEYAALFWHHLRDKGIHTHEGRPNFLTTAHTDEDMAYLVRAFKESAVEMRKGGFLSESSVATTPEGEESTDLNRESRVPLTDGQKEIWTATLLGKEASCAFNESNSIHLSGLFDVDSMQKAIQQVVDRHEALRTSLDTNGEYQKISACVEIDVPLLDFSAMDTETKDAELKRVVQNHVEESFDLSTPPLVRATIVRSTETHHILVFTYHHTIADGWSMRVILNELARLYSDAAQGIKSDLPKPMQYRQYVTWQAEQQQKPEHLETEAFWLAQFSEPAPVLDLPTDRPRGPFRTYNASLRRKMFPASLLPVLKKAGAKRGSTLFSTLFAAFKVFLYRLSNQQETIVGIPTAGQSLMGGTDLIGHGVNFLPLRDRIDGSQTFGEYISSTKRMVLDALEHQNVTFLRLLSMLNLRRDFSRLPLIEAAFNLDRKVDAPRFFNLDVEVIYNPKKYLNFDVFFNFVQTENDLMLECFYNTDLFDRQTIDRWLEHFEALLAQIVTNVDVRIDEISLLSESERQKLLVEWNDTRTNYPGSKSIHQLFEAQAKETPDKIALDFGDRKLTYRQLNSYANQTAHYLKELGVGREELVGICYERSPEMVIALLGILKAGAAYLPLDPIDPQERLDYLLKDSNTRLLITQKKFKNYFPGYPGKMICLDSDWQVIEKQGPDNLFGDIEPGNLAYVMYTSGSTGTPKGVAITHQNVVRLVQETNYAEFLPDDVFLQFAPISFDAATFEIWGALLNGARLVIFPPQVPSLQELAQSIKQNGITILWLPAGLFLQMSESHVEAFQSIRQLLAGGDVLAVTSVQRVLKHRPGIVLINGYGPTENTTFTCCYRMTSADSISFSVPIGHPIANTQVYLLDEHLEPVPVGVIGELYAGGDGLARGYINRPGLTAERFIPNPWTSAGTRLYKTGDLARYRPDGSIDFVGRRDFQVKIRGFRVEPGEVESILSEHPSVQENVVQVLNEGEEKRLVAYVALKNGDPLQIKDLRNFLRKKLPDYMIPSAFVMLEKLPLTSSGKIDRLALPLPEQDRTGVEEPLVGPRNKTEEVLAEMWSQLLRVSHVGIHDNFFELGGHSLLATRVISKLRDLFQVDLSLRVFFERPTVAGLAHCVEHTTRNEDQLKSSPIMNVGRESRKVKRSSI